VVASQEGADGVGIGERVTLAERVRIFKMNEIRDALERTDGSITKAAIILGMPFQTLQNMIRTPKYKELERVRKPPVKRGRRAGTTTGGENRGDATA
jgi:DNA-binding NtrC family response regulator